jgi:peptide/nickel transport system permease protein
MDNRFRNRVLRALWGDPLAIVLLAVLAVILLFTVTAGWVAPADPVQVDYSQALLPPSSAHWLGTDNYGRDEWSRLAHGGIASLGASALAVVLIITFSLFIGLMAGYFGGWVDTALTRIMDVLFSFPQLVLAIALASLMGPGLVSLMIAVAAVSWPSYARIFRSYVLSVRNEGYVLAARAMGVPAWRVIGTHIIGAIAGPILVLVTLDMGSIVLSIASLSFLGLGILPPHPEWGAMLNEGRAYLEEAPWLFVVPGLVIFLLAFASNYLGDTLKDAMEPRTLSMSRMFERYRRKRKAAPPPGRSLGAGMTESPFIDGAASRQETVLHIAGLQIAAAERSQKSPVPILQSVTLQLHKGECLGLVGESGSGKSTLALASMGLLRAPLVQTGGRIFLLGHDTANWQWKDWRSVRGRKIAYITQDPMDSLNPVLKIGVQLQECLLAHGLSKPKPAKPIVMEVLKSTGLSEETYDQYPHQLSGGMRQRVVIAMAMINKPDIIVADEPTTALDVSTQARIVELLTVLQRQTGAAMIFISHDLRIVAQIADRICVMKDGAIVEQGRTRELFTAPQQIYTEELIKAVPVLPEIFDMQQVK